MNLINNCSTQQNQYTCKELLPIQILFAHFTSKAVKMKATNCILLLLIAMNCCLCGAQEILDIVPGMFSKKLVSNGLTLPATITFKPIPSLTTTIHLVDKCYAVFVHYQITMQTTNKDFYSKLLMNYANAGSLVHSGNQVYKTAIWPTSTPDITVLRYTISHR